MNLNENGTGGAERKAADYFESLKKARPGIADKAAAIDRLIETGGENAGWLTLRSSLAIFAASLAFAFFSAYLAFDAISSSAMEPAAAVYMGVGPAVESVSRTVGAGERIAASLISIAALCFASAAFLIALATAAVLAYVRIFSGSGHEHGIGPMRS